MRNSALYVLLCLYNTLADARPYTLEDRVKALKSQAIIPFMNRQAIQRLEEACSERLKSEEIPRITDKTTDFIVVLDRIDELEVKVNDFVEIFSSLIKGLSDEKTVRKYEINDIKNNVNIFRQSIREGIESKLKEQRQTCQSTTKELQKLLEEQFKSDLQDEIKELRNSLERRQGHLEDQLHSREQRISSMYEIKLNTFQEQIKSELKATQELSKEHQDTPEILDEKLHRHIQQVNNSVTDFTEHPLQSCPENWEQHTDTCYLYRHEELPWSSALQKCRDFGGSLVEIKDPETHEFLQRQWDANYDLWIGGKMNSKGMWVWEASGDEIMYLNWNTGAPWDWITGDACLSVFNGKHIDAPCNFRYRYICQRQIGFY